MRVCILQVGTCLWYMHLYHCYFAACIITVPTLRPKTVPHLSRTRSLVQIRTYHTYLFSHPHHAAGCGTTWPWMCIPIFRSTLPVEWARSDARKRWRNGRPCGLRCLWSRQTQNRLKFGIWLEFVWGTFSKSSLDTDRKFSNCRINGAHVAFFPFPAKEIHSIDQHFLSASIKLWLHKSMSLRQHFLSRTASQCARTEVQYARDNWTKSNDECTNNGPLKLCCTGPLLLPTPGGNGSCVCTHTHVYVCIFSWSGLDTLMPPYVLVTHASQSWHRDGAWNTHVCMFHVRINTSCTENVTSIRDLLLFLFWLCLAKGRWVSFAESSNERRRQTWCCQLGEGCRDNILSVNKTLSRSHNAPDEAANTVASSELAAFCTGTCMKSYTTLRIVFTIHYISNEHLETIGSKDAGICE